MNPTDRVRAALRTTDLHAPPAYLLGTCRQRAGLPLDASGRRPSAGSSYDGMTAEALAAVLPALAWVEHRHPAVADGCAAFRAELPGRLGVVALRELPEGTVVALSDPKGTGSVEALVSARGAGPTVGFTVLIVGPHEGREVVYTFHPGEPVRPSTLPAADLDGRRVTAAEAIGMGLEYAKVTD